MFQVMLLSLPLVVAQNPFLQIPTKHNKQMTNVHMTNHMES